MTGGRTALCPRGASREFGMSQVGKQRTADVMRVYKTAVFKIHKPSRRKRALLDDALRRNHLAYTKTLQILTANIETYAVQEKRGRDAAMQRARRKIYDVHKATKSPVALALLERIQDLFAIEADICGRLPEERLAVREKYSKPVLTYIKTEFEVALSKVSGKSSLAKALRYTVSRWEAMTRYTTDGRLDICNNAAERAIRPLALGRKNWLFAGNDGGGESAATIYTLTQTAKMNGLDPEAYLRAVIDRIADHPNKGIGQLLPWNIIL